MSNALFNALSSAKSRSTRLLSVLALAAVVLPAQAVQFTTLAPAFQQQIYTGPLVGGPGMAWTASGHLLTRNGSDILEYDPNANGVHQGTAIHGVIATHSIANLSGSGYGLTNGTDGYIYANTGSGLQRIDPNTWTVTTVGDLPGSNVGSGGYWGITTLPDGRIAWVAGAGINEIHLYDPVAMSSSLIYTAAGLIDDIQASPTGEIALAGQTANDIEIISSTGTLLSLVNTLAYPDGLAFGYGSGVYTLYSNDNMGSITQYDFSAGYTSLLTQTTIATGGSYGDLAAVGPDCALYVSQFYNYNFHGSASFGTHWDNGTTDNDPSIVRISGRDGQCVFAPPGGTVAEPASGALLLPALLGLAASWRRRRIVAAVRRPCSSPGRDSRPAYPA